MFEPFRSRQRQEIIENHVKKTINLNDLINSKVFEKYYRMHTFGGIAQIRKYWLDPRWYWPQPLC